VTTTLRIPVTESPVITLAVFFASTGDVPDSDRLLLETKSWLDEHATDPIRGVVTAAIDRGILRFSVRTRDQVPAPPMGLLSAARLGELEERRLLSATHVVIVTARDTVRHPRFGLWSAIAGARAVAIALDGVILDPALPRALAVASYSEGLPTHGEIHVGKHIMVPMSIGEGGLGWMTTSGMVKFGLPDFEVTDLPPNLDRWAMLMNGMAQRVVNQLLRAPQEASLDAVELESETPLTTGEVAWSGGGNATEARSMLIRLEYGPSDKARDKTPMIRLLPPHNFRGEKGVWLTHCLSELVGGEDTSKGVPTESQAMQRANERAIAELPDIKRRFIVGLQPGQNLYVKQGFAMADGHNEYMWIVIARWVGTTLTGKLANEPRFRKDLVSGQTVELQESDVFDWMLQLPGDRREGGYTINVTLGEGRDYV
jgi:uncharacterized protein YegJ (DUF2314 family)